MALIQVDLATGEAALSDVDRRASAGSVLDADAFHAALSRLHTALEFD